MLIVIVYSQTRLQGSATGNNKGGLCWQMAFVRSVRNYLSEFRGTNQTGLCGLETTTRRCPYVHVWVYVRKLFSCTNMVGTQTNVRIGQMYFHSNQTLITTL